MGKPTRVVVCGMKGVGKTALLEQLIYGNITPKTVRYSLGYKAYNLSLVGTSFDRKNVDC